ncbi:MAG: hypothetical protein KDA22_14400 [Phycisphaerales bacterium]|nr:hypothetical protein [Phycisphaerales bacterium]
MRKGDERFEVPEATLPSAEDASRASNTRPLGAGRSPERLEGLGLALGIGLLMLVDVVIVVVLMRGSGHVALVVPLVLVIPLAFVWLLMRLLWRPLIRRFPAQPVAPNATRRSFQSARLGLLGGFNNCLVIESDADHVHLRLMLPFGWMAPGTASIPRAKLDALARHRFFGDHLVGQIDGLRVFLPAWVGRAAGAERSLDGTTVAPGRGRGEDLRR